MTKSKFSGKTVMVFYSTKSVLKLICTHHRSLMKKWRKFNKKSNKIWVKKSKKNNKSNSLTTHRPPSNLKWSLKRNLKLQRSNRLSNKKSKKKRNLYSADLWKEWRTKNDLNYKINILCYLCTMEIFNIFITLFSAFFIAWTPNQLLLIGLYTPQLRFFHLYLPIVVWFQCFAHALSSNLHVTHERCTLFYLDFGLWFRTWF